MAKWIRDYAAQADANVALRQPAQHVSEAPIAGLHELLDAVRVQGPYREELVDEIVGLGAIDVQELGRSDWEALNSWSRLREMERRRIFGACGW